MHVFEILIEREVFLLFSMQLLGQLKNMCGTGYTMKKIG